MITTPAHCPHCETPLMPQQVRCHACQGWTLEGLIPPELALSIGLDFARAEVARLRSQNLLEPELLTRLEVHFGMVLPVPMAPIGVADPAHDVQVAEAELRAVEVPRSLPQADAEAPRLLFSLDPLPLSQKRPTLNAQSDLLPEVGTQNSTLESTFSNTFKHTEPKAVASLRFTLPPAPVESESVGLDWERIRPLVTENLLWFVGSFMTLVGSFYFASTRWSGLSPLVQGGAILALMLASSVGFAALGRFLAARTGLELAGRILSTISLGLLPACSLPLVALAGHSWAVAGVATLLTLGVTIPLTRRAGAVVSPLDAPHLLTSWLPLSFIPLLHPLLVTSGGTSLQAYVALPFVAVGLWRHNISGGTDRVDRAFGLGLHLYAGIVNLAWATTGAPAQDFLPLAAFAGFGALYLELALSRWKGITRLYVSRLPVLVGGWLLLGTALAALPEVFGSPSRPVSLGLILATGGLGLMGLFWKERWGVRISLPLSLLAWWSLPGLLGDLATVLQLQLGNLLGYSGNLPLVWYGELVLPYALLLLVLERALVKVGASLEVEDVQRWQGVICVLLGLSCLLNPEELRPALLVVPGVTGLLYALARRSRQGWPVLVSQGLLVCLGWRLCDVWMVPLPVQGMLLAAFGLLWFEAGWRGRGRLLPPPHIDAWIQSGMGMVLISILVQVFALGDVAFPASLKAAGFLIGGAAWLWIGGRRQRLWMVASSILVIGLGADRTREALGMISNPLMLCWIGLGLQLLALFWPRRRTPEGILDVFQTVRVWGGDRSPDAAEVVGLSLGKPGLLERLPPTGLYSMPLWRWGQLVTVLGFGVVWSRRLTRLDLSGAAEASFGALVPLLVPSLPILGALILWGLPKQGDGKASSSEEALTSDEAQNPALAAISQAQKFMPWLFGIELVACTTFITAAVSPIGLLHCLPALVAVLILTGAAFVTRSLGPSPALRLYARALAWLSPLLILAMFPLLWAVEPLSTVGMLSFCLTGLWAVLAGPMLGSSLPTLLLPALLMGVFWKIVPDAQLPTMFALPGLLAGLLVVLQDRFNLTPLLSRLDGQYSALHGKHHPSLVATVYENPLRGLAFLSGLAVVGNSLWWVTSGDFRLPFLLGMLTLFCLVKPREALTLVLLLPALALRAFDFPWPWIWGGLAASAVGMDLALRTFTPREDAVLTAVRHRAAPESVWTRALTSDVLLAVRQQALLLAVLAPLGMGAWAASGLTAEQAVQWLFQSPVLALTCAGVALISGIQALDFARGGAPQDGRIRVSVAALHLSLASGVMTLGVFLASGRPAAAILPALALISASLGWLLEVLRRRGDNTLKVGIAVLVPALEPLIDIHLSMTLLELGLTVAVLELALGQELVFVALAVLLQSALGVVQGLRRNREADVVSALLGLGVAASFVRLTTPWGTALAGHEASWLLGASLVFLALLGGARRLKVSVFQNPLRATVTVLPLLGLGLGASLGELTAPWMTAAGGIYLGLHVLERAPWSLVMGSIALNIAWASRWLDAGADSLPLFTVPPGLTLLGIAQYYRTRLNRESLNLLRYGGLSLIYASTYAQSLNDPSHTLLLVLFCLAGMIAGGWLHIRSYLYLGAGVLVATLLTSLVRFGLAHPELNALYLIALGLTILGSMLVFTWKRQQVSQFREEIDLKLKGWE